MITVIRPIASYMANTGLHQLIPAYSSARVFADWSQRNYLSSMLSTQINLYHSISGTGISDDASYMSRVGVTAYYTLIYIEICQRLATSRSSLRGIEIRPLRGEGDMGHSTVI